jgi:nucleoside transporter
MNSSLYIRLSIMMFGQYAIWGVWGPVLGRYLTGPMGFTNTQAGLIYMTMAIASILAPLIAGQIADRYFPTQYYLAVVHLLGAGVLYLLSMSEANFFMKFFGLMMVYQLLYAPTVGLTNSLAFHHLPHGEKQFGPVRLWGAVSWILVGIAFGQWLKQFEHLPKEEQLQQVGQCLTWAMYFSAITAGYCLTLPHTPPSRHPTNPFAFMEAFKLLKEPSFAILTGVSFLVATELQFYYVFGAPFFGSLRISGGEIPGFMKSELPSALAWMNIFEPIRDTNDLWRIKEGSIPQIMTLGQIIEVLVLLSIPWFVSRFGIRATIVIGILAWPIRYGIFSLGQPWWLVVASQGLHGLAYGFFFVGGQMYTDRVAGRDIRASAQSFMVLATAGIGMLLSSLIAGPIVDYFELEPAQGGRPPVTNWSNVFLVPVAITVVGALIFLFGFREKTKEQLDAEFGRAG